MARRHTVRLNVLKNLLLLSWSEEIIIFIKELLSNDVENILLTDVDGSKTLLQRGGFIHPGYRHRFINYMILWSNRYMFSHIREKNCGRDCFFSKAMSWCNAFAWIKARAFSAMLSRKSSAWQTSFDENKKQQILLNFLNYTANPTSQKGKKEIATQKEGLLKGFIWNDRILWRERA